ncbi:MAG: ribosome biogenesis GTP-binding protein YihA/YsxC [Flammeovirgaceae bacterium]|nr:ribosome biogenesis GTP-binding protein YihA/YsxC [Flammeovirgaceae bacterium]
MNIQQATFISSYTQLNKLPADQKPEFAFIGRSNVGKSSLINMLTARKGLAKISSTPGKTQTINHFLINNEWYLVDLPGYGFAKVGRDTRAGFGAIIEKYVKDRKELTCLFILVDSRLEPQKNDINFISWVGNQGIPLAIVFTKTDKLSNNARIQNIRKFENFLLKSWEDLPPFFITSATERTGREELLDFIEDALQATKKNN